VRYAQKLKVSLQIVQWVHRSPHWQYCWVQTFSLSRQKCQGKVVLNVKYATTGYTGRTHVIFYVSLTDSWYCVGYFFLSVTLVNANSIQRLVLMINCLFVFLIIWYGFIIMYFLKLFVYKAYAYSSFITHRLFFSVASLLPYFRLSLSVIIDV
jgi:hypothetical protein